MKAQLAKERLIVSMQEFKKRLRIAKEQQTLLKRIKVELKEQSDKYNEQFKARV